ncbi:MAG: hypothetical protein ABEJ66_02095, partial [Candidatus Nanohaloarchaea archaeon]
VCPMEDPWKYLAFPSAAVTGYLLSLVLTAQLRTYIGLSSFLTRMVVIAAAALITGFIVDELLPAYIDKMRSGRGPGEAGGGDLDGGDVDFG